MRKVGMIVFLIVLLMAFLGGCVMGGASTAGSVGDDHTAFVKSCIEVNGGTITAEQLDACIAQGSADPAEQE